MGSDSAPSASSVSAYMGKAFTKSDSSGRGPASRGFRVSKGFGHNVRDVDWAAVEYIPGQLEQSHYQDDQPALLKIIQAMLDDYAKHLEQRYDVTRNDGDGPYDWNCLLVRKKESSTKAASKPVSSTVSRFLASRFERSHKSRSQVKGLPFIRAGYRVQDLGHADYIVVDWILGENFRSTPQERKAELMTEKLNQIQEFLEEWNYPVQRDGLKLKVFGKK